MTVWIVTLRGSRSLSSGRAKRGPVGSCLRVTELHGRSYFTAWGLIGEPVPPVMISGGPQKKNS